MINRLYVHNFRCLVNFAVDLAGRPSSLVIGKNGSGKSTVRHALTLFQSICRGSNRLRGLVTGSDFSFGRKDEPMRFEVELTLADKRFKYTLALEWPENFREPRVADEALWVDGIAIFSRQQARVTLAEGTTFNLDWHVVALPVITERSGERSIQQVKSFFASMVLIAPIPAQMSGFSEEETVELRSDAGNIASWLNALLRQKPASYALLESHVKSVLPDFVSLENVERGEKGTQLVIKFEQDKRTLSLDFGELADGEKCSFLWALILAANSLNGPVFCLWDEPDSHLSLSEVGHFVTELRKMTNQCGQLVVTSHHPEAIRKFSDENTLVLTRKSHLEPAVPRTLADFSYQGDLVDALIRDEIIG